MTHKDKLSGVIAPLATPFISEEVSYTDLEKNIEKYNDTGLKGYLVLGSNGEFQSLTEEESLRIVDIVQKSKAPDKTMAVGAGRESAKATVEFIKKVTDRGADYAAVLTPHYFVRVMTDEALINYYLSVADRSELPIIIYHAPRFSAGLKVSANMIYSLSGHKNIIGMKNTSDEDVLPYVKAVPEGAEFHILSGNINKFYESLIEGASGGILSIANYLPDICCELYDKCRSGDIDSALKMSDWAKVLSGKASGNYGVAGVKAAMNLLGFFGGEPRIPLLPLNSDEVEELREFFIDEGFLQDK
jgi:4-hydroxy-2-oxoglutarate aldolase